ncbi:MAG: methyltransferase domain-containing protein [Candidatus Doudnabacteria bacterium]|nr:methyltransferase domain-containing protein [Candidatus Doudnabacteria bacterium]
MNTIESIENLINEKGFKVDRKDLENIWNKVWKGIEPDNYSSLRLYKTLDKVRNIENLGVDFTNKNILDIGCGDGTLIKYLSSKYQAQCVGIDISKDVINQNKEKSLINVQFSIGDHRDLRDFESETFDLVISLGVVEHFQEYGLALSEARRVLKTGGKLILIQPHLLSFGVIQEFLLRLTQKWKFGKQYDFSYFYYRKLLKILGFRFIQTQTQPPYFDMRVVRTLDILIKRFIVSWGHYLYIIAQK